MFNTHLSVASWNLALNAALDVLNGGFVEIYSGTQPVTPDTALSGNVLLVTLTLGTPAFASASGGIKAANTITSGVAVATGTASFFRAFRSDSTTAVIDGSVGTASADMIVASTSITAGEVIAESQWTVAMPVAQ